MYVHTGKLRHKVYLQPPPSIYECYDAVYECYGAVYECYGAAQVCYGTCMNG